MTLKYGTWLLWLFLLDDSNNYDFFVGIDRLEII